MPQPPIEMSVGTARRWTITARNAVGAVLTDTFLDSDPLAASVWAGDDREPLFAPDVAWIDAQAATISLTVTAAMSAQAEASTYRLRLLVTPPSDAEPRCVYDGSIRFLPAPGTADPLPVYASAEDLFDHCPRVEKQLADEESAQAGFAEQRARARAWFDEEVLRNYHPVPGRTRRMVGLAGTAVGPYMAFAGPPDGATVPSDAELRAMLDANGLVITDRIVQCVSHKAAALAYETSSAGSYADDAAKHDRMANSLWWRATIEVKSDPDLDGPDLRIGRDVIFLT